MGGRWWKGGVMRFRWLGHSGFSKIKTNRPGYFWMEKYLTETWFNLWWKPISPPIPGLPVRK